jgi:hypothetical protein
VDVKLGVCSHEDAGAAGVVEMDVAEEQVTDVGERQVSTMKAVDECRERSGRPAVEERPSIVRLDDVAADDALGAEVMKVNEVGDPAIVAGSPTERFMRPRGVPGGEARPRRWPRRAAGRQRAR